MLIKYKNTKIFITNHHKIQLKTNLPINQLIQQRERGDMTMKTIDVRQKEKNNTEQIFTSIISIENPLKFRFITICKCAGIDPITIPRLRKESVNQFIFFLTQEKHQP